MYNLKTYAGRLRALSDKHSLSIQTEFNGTQFVNLHTLQEKIWAVRDTSFSCTLQIRKAITPTEFDDGCDSIGFEGVIRDELRSCLFGVADAGVRDEETVQLKSYDLSGAVGRFSKMQGTVSEEKSRISSVNPTNSPTLRDTEMRVHQMDGHLVCTPEYLKAFQMSQPIVDYINGSYYKGRGPC